MSDSKLLNNNFPNYDYLFSSEDSFFLVFISAWLSANRNAWFGSLFFLAMLILSVIFFCLFMSQFRAKMYIKQGNNFILVIGIVGAFLLQVIVVLGANSKIDSNGFSLNLDIKDLFEIGVLFISCCLWFILPIILGKTKFKK